jgi:hypothetical protein
LLPQFQKGEFSSVAAGPPGFFAVFFRRVVVVEWRLIYRVLMVFYNFNASAWDVKVAASSTFILTAKLHKTYRSVSHTHDNNDL